MSVLDAEILVTSGQWSTSKLTGKKWSVGESGCQDCAKKRWNLFAFFRTSFRAPLRGVFAGFIEERSKKSGKRSSEGSQERIGFRVENSLIDPKSLKGTHPDKNDHHVEEQRSGRSVHYILLSSNPRYSPYIRQEERTWSTRRLSDRRNQMLLWNWYV